MAIMRVDLDQLGDALRKLLNSPPVNPSKFQTRRTEEARLYRQLLDASRKRPQSATPPGERET
jgi:hypothetical protein